MAEPKITGRKSILMHLEIGEYPWCSCGQSDSQLFCNGSHKGRGFEPVKFLVDEAGEKHLCMCKHAATPPYCDGTHKSL